MSDLLGLIDYLAVEADWDDGPDIAEHVAKAQARATLAAVVRDLRRRGGSVSPFGALADEYAALLARAEKDAPHA